MSHLHPSEFVDLLDGTLPPDRAEHARACERCRTEAALLAESMEEARAASVPEPSPLFWEHFSARVRKAIDSAALSDQPAGVQSRVGWLTRPVVALAGAAAIAMAALSWYAVERPGGSASIATKSETTAPAEASTPGGTVDETAWNLVAEAAESLAWEESTLPDALSVEPGAAERAVADLSDQQREALAELLREEISRTKS
jgi:hypothetical protein